MPPRDFVEKAYGQADPRLARYVEQVFAPEDEVLAEIRERSIAAGLPAIQMGVFDLLQVEVLVRAVAARKAVEIGTLGGYSGVGILRGLGPDGFLDTCEYDPKHAAVASESFARHGFAARTRIHVGPALDHLPKIAASGPFDLVFIDADKANYPNYLAWAEDNLRVGGMVLADNAFAWGQVLNAIGAPDATPNADAASGKAIHAMNVRLASGGRFRATMLPTAEGLAMGIKIR